MFSNSKLFKWVIPVGTALVILSLVLLTVPTSLTPAKVVGAYGAAGGGGSVGGNGVSVSLPSGISCGLEGTFTAAIFGVDASNVDPASFRLAGEAPVSWSVVNGQLVFVFDPKKCGLNVGTQTIIFTGRLKDGTPFSGTVTITAQ